MEPTVTAAMVVAPVLVATVVWFVRLEGRVNSHDTLFTEREKSVREWLDQHEARDTERHHELRADLSEIKDVLRRHL